LLPFMQSGDGGRPGEGDRCVQAYNFRLGYTQNPANRLPHRKPAKYDPAKYELLARYLEALVAAGHKPQLKAFWNPIWMPNGKTDINNNGGFSTDFIGANYAYPDAAYAARAQIWQAHKDYILGFVYFLATSPRVPDNMRAEMQSWGPAKDEFLDTGHWPHQLYVREARRMVSDYVMTEHDCRGKVKAEDPVGLGAYRMDSHIRHAEIQRLEWRDVRFDEGTIEIHASKAKTASRRLVPIVPVLKEWLLKYRQPSGLLVSHRNVAFELHMIAKTANQLRRAAWASARGITEEQLKQADERARKQKAESRKQKGKLRSQKGEVPPGAETADIEGWEPFAWKNNGLRHSFISYRLAAIQNTAQVALEAGNSPQMIFQHYRELVRPADAERWFAVTLASVEAAKAAREAGAESKIVRLPKTAAA
jgi:integrase